MTTTAKTPHLQVTFQSTLRSDPFKKGFEQRLESAAKGLSWFLKSSKQNGFSDKYSIKPFYSFNVTLCGDHKMRALNNQFRYKDKTTDVLTLALYEDLRSGEEFIFQEVELGDIFISSPVMEKQAKEFKVSVENEFFHLMVHGFLHLLGFDHEISQAEEKLMESYESLIIKKIHSNLKK
jgi:probable rRNA maturation factor